MNNRIKYIEYIGSEYIQNNVDLPIIRECILYSYIGGKKLRGSIYLLILEQLTKKICIDSNNYEILYNLSVYPEFIHTASLILDDMPYMDNDFVRRGKETSHIKYGKAIAQLSAFILISISHKLLADSIVELYNNGYVNATQFINVQMFVHKLQHNYFGEKGLSGGQYLDLYMNESSNFDDYIEMIKKKTSSLFKISFTMPYIVVHSVDNFELKTYDQFESCGDLFGVIFQLLDDIDDIVIKNNNALHYKNIDDINQYISIEYNKLTIILRNLNIDLSDVFDILESNSKHFKSNNCIEND